MSNKGTNYFLAPELSKIHRHFLSLYETLYSPSSGSGKKLPLMIIGPPGVGKTLFSESFIEKYLTDYPESKSKIRRLNIAAIPKDLIESLLFGHKKGAFTGATSDQKGFVEALTDGILVLDEIGELSSEMQAKLLTFIEDGYYYKIGDTEPKQSSNLQIVATTNKTLEDGVFRQDFFDRFFPYHIPPLYQRRQDILYYFWHFFPELLKEFKSDEVLTLLAYNWPGNVREIERIGKVCLWHAKGLIQETGSNLSYVHHLSTVDPSYSNIDLKKASQLGDDLLEEDIDLGRLEQILKRHGVSLGGNTNITPFAELNKKPVATSTTFQETDTIDSFEDAYKGFSLYCGLFRLDETSNQNLLDLQQCQFLDGNSWFQPTAYYSSREEDRAFANILDAYTVKIEQSRRAYDPPKVSAKDEKVNITLMTEKGMLKYYLRCLLKATNGHQKNAAKKAGLPLSTFRDHCKKCGIPL